MSPPAPPRTDLDEDARRRFEAAWQAFIGAANMTNSPPTIEDFVPPAGDPRRPATLVELVAIDLELTWKAGLTRTIDDYMARFPELDTPDIRAELDAEATRRPLVPGAVVGRYRLVAVHARGGFGIVWRAEDTALGREVALKSLARPDDDDARARFLMEARVTAGLEHPGIVPVHELGEREPPWYAMKLVRGQTLADLLSERDKSGGRDRLLTRRLLEAFLGVTRALGFAHARGIVHRDVKPDNILVGDFGETVVLDWGLARSPGAATAPEEDGVVLGTPAYMAPEQHEGRVFAHDARTDVYALGTVLGEVISRHPPRPLASIARRASARDPAERYRDATELGRDVERFLADLPVTAHRENWSERFARSLRRHRTRWAVIGVAAVMALVGGLGWLYVSQRQELERRHEATEAAARDEVLARSELAAGRPSAAAKVLDLAITRLADDPPLAFVREPLVLLKARVDDLDAFQRETENAWFLAGEERDDDALAAITRGLTAAAECDKFGADLPAAEVDVCRRRVHRLLLLDAVLRAKAAVAAPGSDTGRSACVAAWRSLERARAHGPTAFGDLLQSLCALLSPSEVPPVPTRPDIDKLQPLGNATDAFFYGLAHLWMGELPPVLSALAGPVLAERGAGLDFDHPLEAAIKFLRAAARLEPDEYWHMFMLGHALMNAGDFRAADLAFGHCVALRPDYPRALEARGLAAIAEGDHVRGRADFDAVLARWPEDPWTWWARTQMLRKIGPTADILPAFGRALALDPDALATTLPGATRRAALSSAPAIEEARRFAAARTTDVPDDGDAWAVVAAAALCEGDEGDALEAAEKALVRPNPPTLARTVRGIVAWRRGDLDRARAELAPGADDDPLRRRARTLLESP